MLFILYLTIVFSLMIIVLYGNADYFLSCLDLPNNVNKLFAYMYEVKLDVSTL